MNVFAGVTALFLLAAADPLQVPVGQPVAKEPVVKEPVAKEPVGREIQVTGPKSGARFLAGGLVRGQAPAGTTLLSLNDAPLKMAPDGAFVFGLASDAAGPVTLVATRADGTRQRQVIDVAARAYAEQRVDGVPPATVNIPPEQQARRAGEVAQVRAARSPATDRRDWQQTLIWPVTGRISGVYGSRRVYNGQPGSAHMGVDVARPAGTPVRAPAGGVVKLAAPDFLLEGGLIIIDHGFNVYSSFLHLSQLDVKPGDVVTQGQRIGAVGGTGRATAPHLHWNLNWGEVKLDAQLLMPRQPGLQPAPEILMPEPPAQ